MLQETHLPVKESPSWQSEWNGESFFSGNSSNSEGVAILLNIKESYKIISFKELLKGHLVVLELNYKDQDITIINMYGTNKDDETFFEFLNDFLTENDDKNYFIGGDFNRVLDPLKDKRNGRLNSQLKSRNKLKKIMIEHNLIEIWRQLNASSNQYTWHSNITPKV